MIKERSIYDSMLGSIQASSRIIDTPGLKRESCAPTQLGRIIPCSSILPLRQGYLCSNNM